MLGERIPGALSFRPPAAPELVSCGVAEVDAVLGGGLPLGAITEVTGAHSCGHTTLVLGMLAGVTQQGESCAYVDVSDALDPASAAAVGVDLRRLLWVRIGELGTGVSRGEDVRAMVAGRERSAATPEKQMGGGWQHPRNESVGLDRAVGELFQRSPEKREDFTPRCSEAVRRERVQPVAFAPVRVGQVSGNAALPLPAAGARAGARGNAASLLPAAGAGGNAASLLPAAGAGGNAALPLPAAGARAGARGDAASLLPAADAWAAAGARWTRLEKALRATDLLLNTGGFRAVVLDMGDVLPEQASRVPLATWYRFRLQAEKSRTLLLLMTRVLCARSCAAVSLQCKQGTIDWQQAAPGGPRLLAGVGYRVSVERSRVSCNTQARVEWVPRKPVAFAEAAWRSTTTWAR